MQKSFTCLSFVFLLAMEALAQNAPLFNNFYANPFQFNPAYIANKGYTEANVLYRKQWLDINNAPTTMAANFQAPVGRNVAVGFTAYSDKTILLNTTAVLGTFGYRVRLGSYHHLNFALAAGVGFNNFDLTAVGETNDPVLINVSKNNSFLDGQFGFNYQIKNFSIGFALPKLFGSQANSPESFNKVGNVEFDNKFASVSYTASIAQGVKLTPMIMYRSFGIEEDQFEGALIANVKNTIWIGASYRQDYGVTGFIGVNIKNLLRLGYAYEKATGDISQVAGDTHEVFVGVKLGKNNREEAMLAEWLKKDSVKAIVAVTPEQKIEAQPEEKIPEQVVVTEPEPVPTSVTQNVAPVEYVAESPAEIPELVVEESQIAIEEKKIEDVKPDIAPDAEEKPEDPRDPGHYVVVGAYKNLDNAHKQMGYLRAKNLAPGVMFIPEKELHFVFIFHSLVKDAALFELRKIRREGMFYAAWIYSVE